MNRPSFPRALYESFKHTTMRERTYMIGRGIAGLGIVGGAIFTASGITDLEKRPMESGTTVTAEPHLSARQIAELAVQFEQGSDNPPSNAINLPRVQEPGSVAIRAEDSSSRSPLEDKLLIASGLTAAVAAFAFQKKALDPLGDPTSRFNQYFRATITPEDVPVINAQFDGEAFVVTNYPGPQNNL